MRRGRGQSSESLLPFLILQIMHYYLVSITFDCYALDSQIHNSLFIYFACPVRCLLGSSTRTLPPAHVTLMSFVSLAFTGAGVAESRHIFTLTGTSGLACQCQSASLA